MRKYIYFLFCFITLSNTAFAQKSPDKNSGSASNKTLISKDLKISVDKDSGNFIFYAKLRYVFISISDYFIIKQ